jgi:hypothetical protein
VIKDLISVKIFIIVNIDVNNVIQLIIIVPNIVIEVQTSGDVRWNVYPVISNVGKKTIV